MESVFILQNPEMLQCQLQAHTERLQKMLIDHAALYNAHRLFLLLAPPSFPLQQLPSPLPTMKSLLKTVKW